MEEAYNLQNLSVLVVEKQLFMRRLLGEVLNQLGIGSIVKVSSMEQALVLFNQNQFDVIFLDWAPDMDAINFLGSVRNIETSRDPYVPVIVVTAYSEYVNVCKARDAGMTEYMTKPISAKRLYARIKSIIERSRDFVHTDNFFGPDRRRKRVATNGNDRRAFTPDVKEPQDVKRMVRS